VDLSLRGAPRITATCSGRAGATPAFGCACVRLLRMQRDPQTPRVGVRLREQRRTASRERMQMCRVRHVWGARGVVAQRRLRLRRVPSARFTRGGRCGVGLLWGRRRACPHRHVQVPAVLRVRDSSVGIDFDCHTTSRMQKQRCGVSGPPGRPVRMRHLCYGVSASGSGRCRKDGPRIRVYDLC
jgi:hypothetical protein